MNDCFHCGLAVPAGSHFTLVLNDQPREFCCIGCQAIAEVIVSGGLANFYQFRSKQNQKAQTTQAIDAYRAYDLAELQQDFVQARDDGLLQAHLILDGITCAACVWLIEHHLGKIAGVSAVRVNANTYRCLLTWDPAQQQLSRLMLALAEIGFRPQPATEDQRQHMARNQQHTLLMQLAVAGFAMMQAGMLAVGLYVGAAGGISDFWVEFLRWVSFIVTTPVVIYSAQPFFAGAMRALKTGHLVMDVPVALATAGAFAASGWAVLTGGGEVYFDSVSMFIFFLLVGRYLEMRARHNNSMATGRLAQLLPLTADRWDEAQQLFMPVLVKMLRPGDKILISAGATIPCDGVVSEGRSHVVESLLTGEPDPLLKTNGDKLTAGTMNTDAPLQVVVEAVGMATRLSAIESLVDQAEQNKPRQVAIADHLASYFVAAVLVVSVVVFTAWYFIEPARALWVTLSVLVVTCPCALALAAPTALTAAVAQMRQNGLLVTRSHVMEDLNSITRVIFDKTGTLTVGEPQIADVQILDGGFDRERVLALAAALESGSAHPIARAFSHYNGRCLASNLSQHVGQGVSGEVDGKHYRLGRENFALAATSLSITVPNTEQGQWLLLSENEQPVAWISLQDQLRSSALAAVKALQQRGLQVELLSGDASAGGAKLAALLGVNECHLGVSPEQKLARVHELQAQGERVLMVGDGINDVPVLSGANISVAMGSATDLAQTRADSILLSSDLRVLDQVFDTARLTRQIIRQNLAMALIYNLVSLPSAAMGLVPPYMAAIGMSLSSVIVVANALRINKPK